MIYRYKLILFSITALCSLYLLDKFYDLLEKYMSSIEIPNKILFLTMYLVLVYIFIFTCNYLFGCNATKENVSTTQDLLDDETYENYPEDKVKPLKKTIDTLTSKDFFSIGLIGDWGSGKSSYLEKLTKLLLKKDYVVININVWSLGTQANILNELHKELDNKIFKHSPLVWIIEIYKKIIKQNYFSILSKYYNVEKSTFNISLNQTLKDAKKSYGDSLSRAFDNKKLIIIFDELDRLDDKNEIYNIFNTIRYLTSFDNTIVITAVDLNQIKTKIDNIEYVHKIFNMKYFIPIHTKSDLLSYLKDRLDKLKDKDITYLTDTDIINSVENFRELKNCLNDTFVMLKILKKYENKWDYISFEFIFIMNLIKAINFKAFNEIYQLEKLNYMSEVFYSDDGTYQNEYDVPKHGGISTSIQEIVKDIPNENDKKKIQLLIKLLSKEVSVNSSFYLYKYYQIKSFLINKNEITDFSTDMEKLEKKYNKNASLKDKTTFIINLVKACYEENKLVKNTIDFIIENEITDDDVLELIVNRKNTQDTLIKEENKEHIEKIIKNKELAPDFTHLIAMKFNANFKMYRDGKTLFEKTLLKELYITLNKQKHYKECIKGQVSEEFYKEIANEIKKKH
ncbi:MAG: hypothetical protein ACI81I_000530 [Arcobacteraceae bacterium]|jgi:hypothetical protein